MFYINNVGGWLSDKDTYTHNFYIKIVKIFQVEPNGPLSKSIGSMRKLNGTNHGDHSIVPIFHRLLEDRNESETVKTPAQLVGKSLPNIAVKCDIVEYL